MPTLPTITVTQAQLDRIVAAFPGATLAAKAKAYEDWLVNRLIDQVEATEIAVVDDAANAYRATKIAEIRASLPPRR